jgi:hypothetical protein
MGTGSERNGQIMWGKTKNLARCLSPFLRSVKAYDDGLLKKGTGTVPLLFLMDVTCRVARSQSPFSASVVTLN